MVGLVSEDVPTREGATAALGRSRERRRGRRGDDTARWRVRRRPTTRSTSACTWVTTPADVVANRRAGGRCVRCRARRVGVRPAGARGGVRCVGGAEAGRGARGGGRRGGRGRRPRHDDARGDAGDHGRRLRAAGAGRPGGGGPGRRACRVARDGGRASSVPRSTPWPSGRRRGAGAGLRRAGGGGGAVPGDRRGARTA